MFENPLRKYQTGGEAPTKEQTDDMTEFVSWIKSNVDGFSDKSEAEIAQSLIDMSKSEDGKKSVQKLYAKFKESKTKVTPVAKKFGGKIEQFICKHAKGGVVGCGCHQDGGEVNGGYLYAEKPVVAGALASRKTVSMPWPGIKRRRMGAAIDGNGGKHLFEWGDINGNTAQTNVTIAAPGDTVVRQSVATKNGWSNREYPQGSSEYESVMQRFRPFIKYGLPYKRQDGGTVVVSEALENPDAKFTARQARELGMQNYGYTRAQYQTALENAYNALYNQGFRGKELRRQARILASGTVGLHKEIANAAPVEKPAVILEEMPRPTAETVPVVEQAPVVVSATPRTDGTVVVKEEPKNEVVIDKTWMWRKPTPVIVNTMPGANTTRKATVIAGDDRDRKMGHAEELMRITGADDVVKEWNSDQLARDAAEKQGVVLTEVPINRNSDAYKEGQNQARKEAAITTGVGMVAAPAVGFIATQGIPAAVNYGSRMFTRAFGNNVPKMVYRNAELVAREDALNPMHIINGKVIGFKCGGKVKKGEMGVPEGIPNITPKDSSAVQYETLTYPFSKKIVDEHLVFTNTNNDDVVVTPKENGFIYNIGNTKPHWGTYYSPDVEEVQKTKWYYPFTFKGEPVRYYAPVAEEQITDLQRLLEYAKKLKK